ncbi:MAG TPA: D-2-hydroxyacid dehydrogenase [Caulobacteraceae bacterium]|jgi:phosphoglycerate dehydrogenase-like enzyme|nr:D-2-hydroxyacid dehydrogenase [Caulobacteraceae bacterium]
MTRMLIYEPSYRRLESRINAHGATLEILRLQSDGTILNGDAKVTIQEASPEIGWLNIDLFGAGSSRDYMITLLKSPTLKWVQSSAAGFDNPVFGDVVRKGATLTTNHSQAVGMSEYVLTTVLDHLQRGPDRRKAQAEHRWAPAPFREISGSNWLIIGFGAIGQETARRARAFGAHITGVRRSPGEHPLADVIARPDQIASLLPMSDVVVLSLPLTPQSADMVDAEFLGAMKAGSVLVNVGRGGLVDEDALLAALDAGKPEHAILDVFRTEPLPADSRFWDHPRVTLTPHASPISSGLSARSDALFLDNLSRFLGGQPLVNQVTAAEVLGEEVLGEGR